MENLIKWRNVNDCVFNGSYNLLTSTYCHQLMTYISYMYIIEEDDFKAENIYSALLCHIWFLGKTNRDSMCNTFQKFSETLPESLSSQFGQLGKKILTGTNVSPNFVKKNYSLGFSGPPFEIVDLNSQGIVGCLTSLWVYDYLRIYTDPIYLVTFLKQLRIKNIEIKRMMQQNLMTYLLTLHAIGIKLDSNLQAPDDIQGRLFDICKALDIPLLIDDPVDNEL